MAILYSDRHKNASAEHFSVPQMREFTSAVAKTQPGFMNQYSSLPVQFVLNFAKIW